MLEDARDDELGTIPDQQRQDVQLAIQDVALLLNRAESLPAHLVHYTSIEGIAGILGGEGGALMRASDLEYMNDPGELYYYPQLVHHAAMDRYPEGSPARNSMRRLAGEWALSKLHICYAISLTPLLDDLPQWRLYGDSGRGAALVFSTERLQAAVSEAHLGRLMVCEYPTPEQMDGKLSALLDLIDHRAQQFGWVTERADWYRNVALALSVQLETPRMKAPAYEYEREVRAVFEGGVRFRSGANGNALRALGKRANAARKTRVRDGEIISLCNARHHRGGRECPLGTRADRRLFETSVRASFPN